MSRRSYFLLFLAALLVFSLAASLQRVPGYMDAEYYYAGALRIAAGEGGMEPYLWNYLNNPQDLPLPAFGYWMPLVSLLAAGGIKALPFLHPWWAARVPFLLLAACIPPLTAWLSFQITAHPRHAALAGVLALFPGFYLPYLTLTDAFALWMVLGSLFFVLVVRRELPLVARLAGLGLVSGLMHLSRADGLVWLGMAFLAGLYWLRKQTPAREMAMSQRIAPLWALPLGYLLVMGAWFNRNLQAWGAILPPGSSRAMWITEYGQTMTYPASSLGVSSWIAAGWGAHLQGWAQALVANLQTLVAVQGGIVLFPFIVIGAVCLWSRPVIRAAVAAWTLIFGLFTMVFPYSGVNGAFFHSGAAFQPLFWAAAPSGIAAAVDWAARARRWQRGGQVLAFLSVLLVITGALLSGGLFLTKVVGSAPGEWAWERTSRHYEAVEQKLVELGARPADRVMVNDPPGYWLAGGREAVVIPYGDESMLLAAAYQFKTRYLVLEPNNPPALAELYHLKTTFPQFKHLGSVGETQIYEIHFEKGAQ